MLVVTAEFGIPEDELHLQFARSSGPGGQNVNKVSSKAVLRWNLAESQAGTPELRARLQQRLASRLTQAGEIVLHGQRFRDQLRNTEDCRARLQALLAEALKTAKPRRQTRPTRGSVERRHAEKRIQKDRKAQRRRPPRPEE